ncbi:MAG: hypothetical protein DRI57_25610 [Deltaproteobacteria bacterium]|nr:MAG: hypothetical protein DRI57_25610 [Deltaproteobacteria bacterium]
MKTPKFTKFLSLSLSKGRREKELPGIYSPANVLKVINHCLRHFMGHNEKDERFGHILNRTGWEVFTAQTACRRESH